MSASFSGSYATTTHEAPVDNEHGVLAVLANNGVRVCSVHQDVLLGQRNIIGVWKTVMDSCNICNRERWTTQGPAALAINTLNSHETIIGYLSLIRKKNRFGGFSPVQKNGLQTLANLASMQTNKVTIAREGGITTILTLMREYPKSIFLQLYCCQALQNLAFDYSQNQLTIAEGGGITCIFNAMLRSPRIAELQEYGFMALRNLAANDENKEAIANNQGINNILSAMDRHSENATVQKNGCETLLNLAGNGRIKELIAEAGGITTILSAMMKHPKNAIVQEYGCAALWSLAWNNRNGAQYWNQHNGSNSTTAKTAISVILIAMFSNPHSVNVQHYGCAALSNLAENNDENKVMIAEAEGITMILSAMETHIYNADVQHYGCEALFKLARENEKNRRIIGEHNGIFRIISAVKNHSSNQDLLGFGHTLIEMLLVTDRGMTTMVRL